MKKLLKITASCITAVSTAFVLAACNTSENKLSSKYTGTYKNIAYTSEIRVKENSAEVKQLFLVDYVNPLDGKNIN